MARGSGIKPWEIALAVSSFGFTTADPFEIDESLAGVGLDEKRFGMSLEAAKQLIKQQALILSTRCRCRQIVACWDRTTKWANA